MAYFMNINADHMMIGNAMTDDGELSAAIINDVAYRTDSELSSRWLSDFLDELDKDGRKMVKAIAAAIEADDASEGGA